MALAVAMLAMVACGLTSKLPKELTLDCGSSVSLRLVLIPAGEFTMGSPDFEADRTADEGPKHRAKLSRPFYLGAYAVTQAQYQAVMGANPSHFKGDKNPVEQVSWTDAVEFCEKLSAATGHAVRLPTEAEWEYSCRAGQAAPFNTGDPISSDNANYAGSTAYENGPIGISRQRTVPVGSFAPNGFGLYDMHGNVFQWCRDWFGRYGKAEAVDPPGPEKGTLRVLRGGSWNSPPGNCRSASRIAANPALRSAEIGFRVACSPKP